MGLFDLKITLLTEDIYNINFSYYIFDYGSPLLKNPHAGK